MRQRPCSFEASAAKVGRLDYLLSVPRDHDARGRPLILFLHGSEERGCDLERIARHGIPKIAEEDPDFPFVAISPQLPPGGVWHRYHRTLLALLDDVIECHTVDPGRVYLTGVSLGGYGAWHLAAHAPERFAAVVPVCGGGLPSQGFPEEVHALKEVPVWAFHGALDTVVPPSESERLVDLLRRAGGDARLTLYPDLGHDSWTRTYEDPAVYEWLLEHERRR